MVQAALCAVPCPTTLVTSGVLIGTTRRARVVAVVPVPWATVGTSAALVLGITADVALIVAALAMAADVATRRTRLA